MRRTVRGWILALGALALPTGASAHQLDAATASLWERIFHLFSSPDHVLALIAAVAVGGVLVRRAGLVRRREASGSSAETARPSTPARSLR